MTSLCRMATTLWSLFVFVAMVFAQNEASVNELKHYTNDSMGFSIELPCTPVLEPPTIPGSPYILACMESVPMVMIHSEQRSIRSNNEFDTYLKKGIQADGAPVQIKKTKVDGHQARQISLIAGEQHVEMMMVANGDRLFSFALIQPTTLDRKFNPRIFRSIHFH